MCEGLPNGRIYEVNFGINRCFSTAIPYSYRKRIETAQKWLRAGQGRDWLGEIYKAWREYRRSLRMEGISVDELIDLIGRLTSGEMFGKYVNVEKPYKLGVIRREQELSGPFPKYMFVQAFTDLNLKQCVADGYLIFEKKKYINKIKESIDSEE